jgi:hypothetical protein
MTYWVIQYRSDGVVKATGRWEMMQTYAGPFASATEAWTKAHELNDEYDRRLLRTSGPDEAGIMFGVLSDEEIAEAGGLGVRIVGNRASV